MMVENRHSRAHTDVPLMLLVMAMSVFGVLAVTVATFPAGGDPNASLLSHLVGSSYAIRQTIFLLVSPIIMVVIMNLPYDLIRRMTPTLYISGTILLAVVWIFNRAQGVKAWLDIIWGFTIQPSEFAKLSMILMLARYLSQKDRPLTSFREVMHLALLLGVPSVIIIASGEMGSLLVIIFLAAVMLYFANVDMRLLLGAAAIGTILVLGLYAFLVATNSDNYRLKRILGFLNPDLYASSDAYQMRQSMKAIGSGGMNGIGIFVEGALSQLNYVPADWTDFIFATIGEAWGFVGCVVLLLGYLLIILRMLYLARYTRDKYGMLIICGVIGMLLFHVFENVGMTLGLMPITGIPLPFLSYGGSNMVTNVGGVALVLNVTKHRSLTSSIITPQTQINPYARGTRL